MAVYAIGDVQGCYTPLCRLLDQLRFDSSCDQLWLTGDLVNRGPESSKVLGLVRSLQDAAVTVLGNHDLTLLAVAEGFVKARRKDTFYDILDAPEAAEHLDWIRHCPLLHHDAKLGFTMVHAGLAPQWDLAQAQVCAAELEETLRGLAYRGFLAHMFGEQPDHWDNNLAGMERLRCIVNICTRMRFCTANGRLDFGAKGAPGSQPLGLMPWFQIPARRNADLNIIFGHWAALGYYREPGIYALDSGCVWGQHLTALQIDQDAKQSEILHQVSCASCCS